MTDELTKTFFDAFGIEPKLDDCNWQCQKPSKLIYMCENNNDCEYCKEYPQITDRILLELILIIMHYENLLGYPTNIQELKDNTLKQLLETYNKFCTCVTFGGELQQMAMDIKHQVRTLFEEE